MEIAARHADEWYPVDAGLAAMSGGLGEGIGRFRELVERAGRDPDEVPITMFCWGWEPGNPSVERLKGYEDLDLYRVVLCPMNRHDAGVTLRRLDEFASLR
jgi:hypothetical protein